MTSKRKPPLQPPPAIMTESPVPGVNLELASLLVQAVKARRKLLSKFYTTQLATNSVPESSNAEVAEVSSALQTFQDKADDATTSFLNELRRLAVHHSSQSNKTRNNASICVTHCLAFLLEIICENNNSFHLRRSALALIREILERSSHGRMYFSSERHLLEFVSMVENCEEMEGETNRSSGGHTSKSTFQQEAIDLIHHLSANYGQFYAKFVVASRMLGHVSVSLSMNEHDESSGRTNIDSPLTGRQRGCDSRRRQERRRNMQILRRIRDVALQHGGKLCFIAEKMVEKGDELLRTIVPRFGGLIDDTPGDEMLQKEEDKTLRENTLDSTSARNECETSSKHVTANDNTTTIEMNDSFDAEAGIGADDYDEDDGSIAWEEGDDDLLDENGNVYDGSIVTANEPMTDTRHLEAVERTLTVMERSGALLDGEIDVRLGISDDINLAIDGTNCASKVSASDSKTICNDNYNTQTTARGELHELINKLSAKYLSRMKRWIHALSHADGMVERIVSDPAAAPGTIGPASLVLLPQEQRSLRGPMLQQIIKLKGRIEHLIELTARVGIFPIVRDNDSGQIISKVENSSAESKSKHLLPLQRNMWLKGNFVVGNLETSTMKKKRKQPKYLKLKVVYNKK